MLDEAELKAAPCMVGDDNTDDIWLFAYGSLIWNPALEIAATRPGRIYGYRRRFCLRTMIDRGTPDSLWSRSGTGSRRLMYRAGAEDQRRYRCS